MAPQSNGTQKLLTTLIASGDRWIQLAVLLLVTFSGLGNWNATWNSADRNKAEIEAARRENSEGQERIKAEVVRQVAEIHKWLTEATDEFHNGNKDSADNKKMLEEITKKLDKQ
jgi:hypothetical protein